MDKQNRLTKIDEWELGAKYNWFKRHVSTDIKECVEINKKEDFVKLKGSNCEPVTFYGWRKRFKKVYNENN